MSHNPVRHLTFVATEQQAASVDARWRDASGRRVVICLDEALFPVQQARKLFAEAEVYGLSALELEPRTIVEEALQLTEDLFSEREKDPIARVERWMLESIRRWLVYAVHSVRLVEEAFRRYQPEEVWLPDYEDLRLTISPDVKQDNPFFFDLLPALCRRSKVKANLTNSRRTELFRRTLGPMKFVIGQWFAGLRQPHGKPNAFSTRPVLLTNLDNDLHRQFDLTKLDSIAEQTFAWLRDGEQVVPLEEFLANVAVPETTRHGWLQGRQVELGEKAMPAGTGIRPLAGLRFLINLIRSERNEYQRRKHILDRNGLSWWDLLFGSEVPYIHRECRLAGAFYGVYEYERTRAVLLRWKPELLVICDFWTDLPKLSAAKDLGITSLMTSAGINFIENDFAERIAPIVCVYGEAEARRTKEAAPNVVVIQGGDSLVPSKGGRDSSAGSKPPPRRILVATSGRMFGWWFGSLLFNYRVFEDALRSLAVQIRKSPEPVSVVIKSHPVSDLHGLYDRLVSEHGDVFVEHRKAPISEDELVEFDAAVLFSAATTFLAELIRARVPVIYFDGALTRFGKSYFDYEGLMLAEKVEDLYAKLTSLIDGNREARASVLHQGDAFLSQYIAAEARPFSSVIQEIFHRNLIKTQRPGRSSELESVDVFEASANSYRGVSSLKP